MKVLIKHLKDLIKDEEGNSLMEFALVFPLLILLTLGNIYLSISFTQKADMNGIAFLQARALSVHSPRLAPSSDEIKNGIQTSYIEKSGHNWVEKVKSDYSYSDKDVKVSLIKEPMRIDLLANAISILGGSKPQSGDKITQIKTVMSLPTEYTSGDGDRPLTSTTVDYKTYPVGGQALSSLLDKGLFSFVPSVLSTLIGGKYTSFVDDASDTSSKNGIISSDPTKNMKNVDDFYKTWGLDTSNLENSSEEPVGGKLQFMARTGEFIRLIEASSYATDIALNFVPALGQILRPILDTLQSSGGILGTVETAGTNVSDQVEKNNNSLFGKSITDIDLGE